MEDSTVLLEVLYETNLVGPFEYYDFTITISKNNLTNEYDYLLNGHYGDRHRNYSKEYKTFEEALEELFKSSFGLIFFEILYIKELYKFQYTKKLIEQLNKARYTSSVSQKDLDRTSIALNIKLKMIKNAEKKGVKIIKLKNNNSAKGEIFLVGKLDISGNSIIIKDKKGEIEQIISNDNFNISTEKIEFERYYYFTKM
jgi:hypothetical protein